MGDVVQSPTQQDIDLAIKRITVVFGGVVALDSLDLDVARGSVHAVIGPNGAGKTTLLNCISGLVTPSDGEIRFDGHELTKLPAHRRASLGIARTFQNPSLVHGLNASDNVELGLFARGGSSPVEDALMMPRSIASHRLARRLATEAMDYLQIAVDPHQAIASLPLGTRKLLDLARAWVSKPKLLLLDEPTAGLAESEIQAISDALKRVAGKTTIVLIAHHLEFVLGVADIVTVLDFGRRVAEGPPATIRNNDDVIDVYIGRTQDAKC